MNVCIRSVRQQGVYHEDKVLSESGPRLSVPLDVDEDEAGRHPASPVLQGIGRGPGDLISLDNCLTCHSQR